MSKRLKFFLSHFLLSFLIALLVVGLVFFIWYPAPLAKAVGVTHIFLMMLAIDVIVGPILGFVVYKDGKKSFKTDLSVIIVLQLFALAYGLFSIEQGRPAYIAYVVDRFELIRKNEIVDQNIQKALPQYQQVSWFKPPFVGTAFAKDTQQRNDEMFAEVFSGISIAQRPERYIELTQAKASIKQRAQPLALLKDFNDPNVVKMILVQYPQANAFIPLKANALDMTVLVNKNTGDIIKIVDLRPWN